MFKYKCRECPIRNRCIDQSNNATSIKIMMRHAFEARTDTLATWGRLQENCLRVKTDAKAQQPTTTLSSRLRQARAAKEMNGKPQNSGREVSKKPMDRRNGHVGREETNGHTPKSNQLTRSRIPNSQPSSEETGGHNHKSDQAPEYLQPVSRLKHKYLTGSLRTLSSAQLLADDESELYWLTVENTWRHIALPIDGALVLGRFDPGIGSPPDIDLAYEDQQTHLVARRHASITGKNGQYIIEDLGSKSGVLFNDEQLGYRPSRPLKPGDRIKLGTVQLIFDKIPPIVLKSTRNKQTRHVLTVTATGHKLTITPPDTVLIGHSDGRVSFMPDIDMHRYGPVAQRVSRRHAHIQWRDGQPYLEDLGSGFGTRLRGDLLPLGQATRLVPGDHIWLAGCVLAYDVEAEPVSVA